MKWNMCSAHKHTHTHARAMPAALDSEPRAAIAREIVFDIIIYCPEIERGMEFIALRRKRARERQCMQSKRVYLCANHKSEKNETYFPFVYARRKREPTTWNALFSDGQLIVIGC